MDYTFLKSLIEKSSQKARVVKDNAIFFSSIQKPVQPKTSNPSQTKLGSKVLSKSILQLPLNRNRADSRLIIWLGKTLLYKSEHLFFFQKKANATLPLYITVKKIANVKIGIALVPANRIILQQLEKYGLKLA